MVFKATDTNLHAKKGVCFSDVNRIATYDKKYDPGKSLNLRLIRSIS